MPQAAALTKSAKLKVLSEGVFENMSLVVNELRWKVRGQYT